MTAPARRMHSVPDIVAMLAAQIERLAMELLPAGKREGPEWRVGSVAGEPGQSLAVHIGSRKPGIWCDYSSSDPRQRGDALDLVAMVRFGGDKSEALRWARAWLGLDSADPDAFRAVQAVRPAAKERQERDESGQRLRAKRLWLEGVELPGTPAADYLASRGLPVGAFRPVPRAIRYHAECWCSERQGRHPAMVTAITVAGRHVATHRTYLAQTPAGWRKAPIARAKKVLGLYSGGLIPLWRGASGLPLREAPAGDVVAITEGIEDGLTLALHTPAWRVVAAVSLSNMSAVQLPPTIQDVVLVFDRDGENRQARQARGAAIRRFEQEGCRVREFMPPEGFKDLNAWHQAEGLDVLEPGDAA